MIGYVVDICRCAKFGENHYNMGLWKNK